MNAPKMQKVHSELMHAIIVQRRLFVVVAAIIITIAVVTALTQPLRHTTTQTYNPPLPSDLTLINQFPQVYSTTPSNVLDIFRTTLTKSEVQRAFLETSPEAKEFLGLDANAKIQDSDLAAFQKAVLVEIKLNRNGNPVAMTIQTQGPSPEHGNSLINAFAEFGEFKASQKLNEKLSEAIDITLERLHSALTIYETFSRQGREIKIHQIRAARENEISKIKTAMKVINENESQWKSDLRTQLESALRIAKAANITQPILNTVENQVKDKERDYWISDLVSQPPSEHLFMLGSEVLAAKLAEIDRTESPVELNRQRQVLLTRLLLLQNDTSETTLRNQPIEAIANNDWKNTFRQIQVLEGFKPKNLVRRLGLPIYPEAIKRIDSPRPIFIIGFGITAALILATLAALLAYALSNKTPIRQQDSRE